jgi:hypothetical protein
LIHIWVQDLALGRINEAPGGSITTVQDSTPQYSRLKYIYIKACVMEDIDKSYTCGNIYILSEKWPLKPLNVPR